MFLDIIFSLAPMLLLFIIIVYFFSFLYLAIIKIQKKRNIDSIKRYTLEFILNDDNDYIRLRHGHFKKSTDESKIHFLMFLDKIAIGVLNEVFDEEIIYDHYSKYFFYAMRNYNYFISKERSINEDPFFLIGYEKILNKWRSRTHFWGDN